MSTRMLINVSEEESRVAVIENQVLQDLHVESVEHGRLHGNIYKARIVRVETAIQACFIDYGGPRNGFITFDDIGRKWWLKSGPAGRRPRIDEVLKSGMHLMVQCTKEPGTGKGAAFTTQISLPGRYVVLLPDAGKSGGVSRRIEDEEQRERLRELLAKVAPEDGHAVIIRTMGTERTKLELERDIGYLNRLWSTICADYAAASKPGLIFREQDVVFRCIRDHYAPEMEEVLIDDEAAHRRALEYVKAAMPRLQRRFQLYTGAQPLFERFGVEEQIEGTYRNRAPLPSGGAIVIDPTEALVSIDVNSGKAMRARTIEETALNTNLEAAAEVARQLRLRDLGGLIVVDFIDMRERKHQAQVEATLRQAMKRDKARHLLGRISQFGLLEMSRQRLQGTVAPIWQEPCPTCKGTGAILSIHSGVSAAMRRIRALAGDAGIVSITATLPHAVAMTLLNEKRDALAHIEGRTGMEIRVLPGDIPAGEPGTYETERGERPVPVEPPPPPAPEERVPPAPPRAPAARPEPAPARAPATRPVVAARPAAAAEAPASEPPAAVTPRRGLRRGSRRGGRGRLRADGGSGGVPARGGPA